MYADTVTMAAALMSGVALAFVAMWLGGRIGSFVVASPARKPSAPGPAKPVPLRKAAEPAAAPSSSAVVLAMLGRTLPEAYEIKGPLPRKIERALEKFNPRVEVESRRL